MHVNVCSKMFPSPPARQGPLEHTNLSSTACLPAPSMPTQPLYRELASSAPRQTQTLCQINCPPHRLSERMPDRMLEQMSGGMTDRIPDRMCQIECQDIRQIECQNICQIKVSTLMPRWGSLKIKFSSLAGGFN